jgi:hypothetical protein
VRLLATARNAALKRKQQFLLCRCSDLHAAKGDYEEALKLFKAAGAVSHAVQIELHALGDAQRAAALVRESRNADAAGILAEHCLATAAYAVSTTLLSAVLWCSFVSRC